MNALEHTRKCLMTKEKLLLSVAMADSTQVTINIH